MLPLIIMKINSGDAMTIVWFCLIFVGTKERNRGELVSFLLWKNRGMGDLVSSKNGQAIKATGTRLDLSFKRNR